VDQVKSYSGLLRENFNHWSSSKTEYLVYLGTIWNLFGWVITC